MMLRLRRQLCVMVGALCLLSAAPELALAQDPPHSASKRQKREKRRKKREKKQRGEAASAPKHAGKGGRGPEPKPGDQGTSPQGENTAAKDAARAAQDAAQGANSEIVKEGDTSVKVMEFSGLDIEGRLKSPQLLYFVNRVRAEFDRPRLPHRSFMPELESSTKQEPLQ